MQAFFETPATKGQPVGVMAEADWAAAVKTLSDNKVIKGGKPGDLYTNALLDPALIKKTGGKSLVDKRKATLYSKS